MTAIPSTHPMIRTPKRAFAAVNGTRVLEQLEQLSIQSWQYKAQPESIRHIGPTAQEFYNKFDQYGETDTRISSVDADGVLLIAVQALSRRVQAQASIISRQDALLEQAAEREANIASRLAKIEAALGLT